MGYIGNQQTEGYSQVPPKQDLTGATGTSLTLTHAVASAEGIDLFINNVRQEPTTAYSVTGTAVTLTGSVVATDDIYVVYNSLALQTTVPPDGSVSGIKLQTGIRSYGAIGDSITDDTIAIQNALNSGVNILDGEGKTYKVTSTLNMNSNTVLQNLTINFATASDSCLAATGTQGAALTLTSDSNYPTRTVSLSTSDAATLAEGDMVFITDSQDFVTSVDRSEINFVSAVSGTTVTLLSEVFTDYTTANSATISKITPKENIVLRNVNLCGANDATTPANQSGLDFDKCKNINLESCKFEKFDTRLTRFKRSAHIHISGCYFSNSDRSGYGYGVTVSSGTHYITVTNSTFERMRHGVATGGDAGVNRYVNVLGCTFSGMKDAMCDCHAETDFVNFSNNISNFVEDNGTDDGVLISGGNAIVSNNIIDRPHRHGVLIQNNVLNSAVDKDVAYVVTGNLIKDVGTSSGITINSLAAANRPLRGVTISGNTVTGSADNGINIKAAGAGIRDVCISANTISQASGNSAIHINAEDESGTAADILTVAITGNTCSLTSDLPDACIELNESGSSSIVGVCITGNSTLNGTYGVKCGSANKVVIVGNMIDSPGTGDVSSASASNVTIASNG